MTAVEHPPQVCPECRDGKHANCDGTAWDDPADDYGICTCDCLDGS